MANGGDNSSGQRQQKRHGTNPEGEFFMESGVRREWMYDTIEVLGRSAVRLRVKLVLHLLGRSGVVR